VEVSNTMSELDALTSRATELSSKATFWNNAVLWALALTAVAAVAVVVSQRLAFVRAKQLSDIQANIASIKEAGATGEQQRIGRELAAALVRVAEAEARAAEANLELAKLRDPRKLLPEQQDRIIAALKRFTGQKFSFNVYPDPESLAFLRIIDALLKSAGWERVPSQVGDVEVDAAGSTAGTAYDGGVDALIAPDDENSKPALITLASALTKEGTPCTPHYNDRLIGKIPKAILINIGKKL
jgi:hypothetical protein